MLYRMGMKKEVMSLVRDHMSTEHFLNYHQELSDVNFVAVVEEITGEEWIPDMAPPASRNTAEAKLAREQVVHIAVRETPDKLKRQIRTLHRMGMMQDATRMLYDFMADEGFDGTSVAREYINGIELLEEIVGEPWSSWYLWD